MGFAYRCRSTPVETEVLWFLEAWLRAIPNGLEALKERKTGEQGLVTAWGSLAEKRNGWKKG